MPLSWNEIRDRATRFANEWESAESEKAEKQTFWNEFFDVFGVRRRSVAAYEEKVKQLKGDWGFIDLFWPGMLVVEHKSAGKDLDSAFAQATDYLLALKERERPRYVITSDFRRLRLYDLEPAGGGQPAVTELGLKDLPKKIRLFGFVAGYSERPSAPEDSVNVKAAYAVAKLHDALKAGGYVGHPLEALLVRLVFMFFADDTGIFSEKDLFRYFVENRTTPDGSDFGAKLIEIFQTLDTPPEKRQAGLDEDLNSFCYVDGHLFSEQLPVPAFDSKMRDLLLDCVAFDWSTISPAIFGSMFQSVMDEQARHDLGAHYTSEKNILKVIGGLFLDDLKAELESAGKDKNALRALHEKLASLKFLDPACGCGNFLVVTYRELRLLEIEILKRLFGGGTLAVGNVGLLSRINVDRMYGIEIEEFPVRVAELALWLTDHQMNLRLGEAFGQYYARLPLKAAPHIVQGNALKLDWESVVPKNELSFIFGNPPFIGARVMNAEQKAEIFEAFGGLKSAGELDYVTGWYAKAARYIQDTKIEVAFVSTNSITQGEQVGILWPELWKLGVRINFAHRTFRWTNEARGKAHVYCVIIGFALSDRKDKRVFDYADIAGEPQEVTAKNINPYLADAPNIVVTSRSKPLCAVPEIGIGNKPIDGGNYLFTPEEKAAFLKLEPAAEKYFRRWLGAEEFINGVERWCLWLGDVPPEELRRLPEAMKRVEAVRQVRLASKSAPTRKLAETPRRFHVENMPKSNYLLIPRHSSENRKYIPFGYIQPDILVGDSCLIIDGASLYHFGVLTSAMHMAWVRQVCGRLESRYRYSKDVVYNNFPWPESPAATQIKAVEVAAQTVIDARAAFPKATLADLYDPDSMPKQLLDAHRALDAAVDRCYGKRKFTTEMDRVKFLFERYQALVAKKD